MNEELFFLFLGVVILANLGATMFLLGMYDIFIGRPSKKENRND